MAKFLAGVMALTLAIIVLIGSFIGFSSSKYTCQPADADIRPPAAAGNVSAKGLDKKQLGNAGLIVGIGKSRGRSQKDIKVALMVARQESGMRNISYGDRDSLGLYQQRAGWGTARQRLDPVYAINAFYKELEKIKNRANRSLLDIALAVQRPSRAAYLSPRNNFNWWDKMADQLLANFSPSKTTTQSMVYDDDCSSDGRSDNVNVSGRGWTKPLNYLRIGSPFGPRFHPILRYTRLHNGIDLSSPKGAKIYAMGPGKIITMDAGYNGGAGRYIAIDHGGGYVVKYLHTSRFAEGISVGDNVKAGTLVAYVGSTGLSTAPHLHLQLNKNGRGVDPVPYMCGKGISVPGPKGCAKLN